MGRNPKRRLEHLQVKGKRRQTAMILFGLPLNGPVMETPEQRMMMIQALRHSDDERMRALAKSAADPMNARVSFSRLAEDHRVNAYMIAKEFEKIMKAEGIIRQAQHLPELMEAAAIDAKSKWEECETCDGVGTVPDAEAHKIACAEAVKKGEPMPTVAPRMKCKNCKGEGQVYVMGDIDRLKLVFETYGLTGKASAAAMNVLNISNPAGAHETLHDLAGSLSGIIEGEVK